MVFHSFHQCSRSWQNMESGCSRTASLLWSPKTSNWFSAVHFSQIDSVCSFLFPWGDLLNLVPTGKGMCFWNIYLLFWIVEGQLLASWWRYENTWNLISVQNISWLVVWNMACMTFHSVGNVIIPTDFQSIIFQRGRAQPPSSFTR